MNVCISRFLKEELALAIDKQLPVISTKMLFKTVIRIYTIKKLKNEAILNLEQYCMCCYVTHSNLF